jgi:hypothetical protein
MRFVDFRSLSFLILILVSVAGCGDDPKTQASDTLDTADTLDTSDAAETTSDSSDIDVVPDGDTFEPDTALDTDAAGEDADTTGLPDAADAADAADGADGADAADVTDVPDATDTTDVVDVVDVFDAADTTEPDTTALDAASDVTTPTDTTPTRLNLNAGFCPSTPTVAGLYRGTLASNLNDIGGACGLSAPGRDGAVRVELQPGQTVRAAYRHAGDGVLYLLDSCPVVGSCLASSDDSFSGEETLEWTHTGATMNPVYIILDSDDLGGGQTFELDLEITGP